MSTQEMPSAGPFPTPWNRPLSRPSVWRRWRRELAAFGGGLFAGGEDAVAEAVAKRSSARSIRSILARSVPIPRIMSVCDQQRRCRAVTRTGRASATRRRSRRCRSTGVRSRDKTEDVRNRGVEMAHNDETQKQGCRARDQERPEELGVPRGPGHDKLGDARCNHEDCQHHRQRHHPAQRVCKNLTPTMAARMPSRNDHIRPPQPAA